MQNVLNRRFVVAGMAALGASLWTHEAHAVVREITVVGDNGVPIPGADITIHIPRKPKVVRRRKRRGKRVHTVRRPRPDRVVRRKTDRTGRARIALPRDMDCGRPVLVEIRVGRRRFVRRGNLCRRDMQVRLALRQRSNYATRRPPRRLTREYLGGEDADQGED